MLEQRMIDEVLLKILGQESSACEGSLLTMYDIDEFDVQVDLLDAIKTYPVLSYSRYLPLFPSMPVEVIPPIESVVESIPRHEGGIVLEVFHHESRNINISTSTKVVMNMLLWPPKGSMGAT